MSNPFDKFDVPRNNGAQPLIEEFHSDPVSVASSATSKPEFYPAGAAIAVVLLVVILGVMQKVTILSAMRRAIAMQKEKQIVALTCIALVFTALFPPWFVSQKDSRGHIQWQRVETDWLLSPPREGQPYCTADVAFSILAIEWLAIVSVAGGSIFLLLFRSARHFREQAHNLVSD